MPEAGWLTRCGIISSPPQMSRGKVTSQILLRPDGQAPVHHAGMQGAGIGEGPRLGRGEPDHRGLPRLEGCRRAGVQPDDEGGEEQGGAPYQRRSATKTRTAPPIIFMISETAV